MNIIDAAIVGGLVGLGGTLMAVLVIRYGNRQLTPHAGRWNRAMPTWLGWLFITAFLILALLLVHRFVLHD